MKIKTRLTALITVCIAAFGIVFATPAAIYAAPAKTEDETIEMLCAIGLDAVAGNSGYITRGEFVSLAMGLEPRYNTYSNTPYFVDVNSSHAYFGAVQKAYELNSARGLGDNHFYPDNHITCEEAAKLVVSVLGFDTAASLKGGYPLGYLSCAMDLGLMKGVKTGSELSYTDAYRLIYNALFVTVLDAELIDGGVRYEDSGETLLANRFSIYYVDGVVTAVGKQALKPDISIGDDWLEIGGDTYLCSTDYSQYLGYDVRLYYHEDRFADDCTAVAIFKDRNNSVISVKDDGVVSVSSDTSSYSIEYDAGNKTKKIKVARTADVVYNGRCDIDYDINGLSRIACGEIEFICNDGSGIYNVLIVTEYKSAMIEGVDGISRIIYFKDNTVYGMTDKKLNLPEEHDDVEVDIVDMDGINVDLQDLKANYVVSVAKSHDNSFIKIFVTNEIVYASASGSNLKDKKITLNGEVYDISSDSLITADKISYTEILSYYMNYFGQVIWVDRDYSDNLHYGYAVSMKRDECDEEIVRIRIFNESGNFDTYMFLERIKFDGTKTDSEDLIEQPVFFDGAEFKPQLVRYKLKDNKISEIECAKDYTSVTDYVGYDEAKFSKDKTIASNGRYRKSVHVLDCSYMLTGKTIVFMIPTDVRDYEAYGISDYNFYNSDASTLSGIDVYDSDCAKVPAVLVVNTSLTEFSDTAMLVDYISEECIDGDDEVRTVIYGFEDGLEVRYVVSYALENSDVQKLKRGDVLMIKKTNGEISDFMLTNENSFDNFAEYTRDPVSGSVITASSNSGKFVFVSGTIANKRVSSFTVSVDGKETSAVYPITEESNAYVIGRKGIRKCNISEVSVGMRVFVHRRYDAARLILIWE